MHEQFDDDDDIDQLVNDDHFHEGPYSFEGHRRANGAGGQHQSSSRMTMGNELTTPAGNLVILGPSSSTPRQNKKLQLTPPNNNSPLNELSFSSITQPLSPNASTNPFAQPSQQSPHFISFSVSDHNNPCACLLSFCIGW